MTDIETAVMLYSGMVYKLACARMLNKADAEDVYQEVFLRYVRKSPSFESEEHRKAWLIRVTVNCAAKCAKQRARAVPAEITDTGEAEPFAGEDRIELLEALSKLPPKYREVIHLFYFEDMPAEDIAKLLRRRRSTVTSQLSRARKMLKKFLEED